MFLFPEIYSDSFHQASLKWCNSAPLPIYVKSQARVVTCGIALRQAR